jgi:hypothetical protein
MRSIKNISVRNIKTIVVVIALLFVVYKLIFAIFNNVYSPTKEIVKNIPVSKLEKEVMKKASLKFNRICQSKPIDTRVFYLKCNLLDITDFSIINNSVAFHGTLQYQYKIALGRSALASLAQGLTGMSNFSQAKGQASINYKVSSDITYSNRSLHLNNNMIDYHFKKNVQKTYSVDAHGGVLRTVMDQVVSWFAYALGRVMRFTLTTVDGGDDDAYDNVHEGFYPGLLSFKKFFTSSNAIKGSKNIGNKVYSINNILSLEEPIIWNNKFLKIRIVGRVSDAKISGKNLVLYIRPKLEAY